MKLKPIYIIGTDTYDSDSLVYCLTKTTGASTEVILNKAMKDKSFFEEEVNNLAKYFDATILVNEE